jgi:hypothetical protein
MNFNGFRHAVPGEEDGFFQLSGIRESKKLSHHPFGEPGCLGSPCLMSRKLFYQPTKGLIIQVMQDINELPFGTLTGRKSLPIPGPQRTDVCVAVFPREPPAFIAVASVHIGLIHWFPLRGFLDFL